MEETGREAPSGVGTGGRGPEHESGGGAPRPRQIDYAELMKSVEELVAGTAEATDAAETVHLLAHGVIEKFRDELGILGGRIYRRRGADFVVVATFGAAKVLPDGMRLAADYEPMEDVLQKGAILVERGDGSLDPRIEKSLGVEKFAAIRVGDEPYILAFDVAPDAERSGILFSLGILRHSIDQRLRQERMTEVLREARRIQNSILPQSAPSLGPFEIRGRTESLEIVGGDFYDFIEITDKIVGVAIADVTGHGLPAALQVRDIYTGLRMGMSRDYKIVRTVERLNGIIHESTLTSRFVSMFYGEIDVSGIFIYVNAGHNPPFHVASGGRATPLSEGGAVLGPIPGASYERGYVRLAPGDLVVLYTDGIVEAKGRGEDGQVAEYGVERLLRVVRRNRRESAEAIIDRIFEDLKAFGRGRPQSDDRTVVVVKYPEPPAAEPDAAPDAA